jgi:hypothetical protein
LFERGDVLTKTFESPVNFYNITLRNSH